MVARSSVATPVRIVGGLGGVEVSDSEDGTRSGALLLTDATEDALGSTEIVRGDEGSKDDSCWIFDRVLLTTVNASSESGHRKESCGLLSSSALSGFLMLLCVAALLLGDDDVGNRSTGLVSKVGDWSRDAVMAVTLAA